MNISQTKKDNIIELSISGRLDAVSAVEADKILNTFVDAGNKIFFINLAALDYISSAGLRVLLIVAKRVNPKSITSTPSKANGEKVVLCSLSSNVKEIFEISGFSSIFNVLETSDEAIQYLKNIEE